MEMTMTDAVDSLRHERDHALEMRAALRKQCHDAERERDTLRALASRIAEAMGCEPESDDDLVEAVRLLVAERDALRRERDEARAEEEST